MMSEVTAAKVQQQAATINSPVLLCELEPWHRVFLRNLTDLVLRREPPPVATTATPVPLRRDYFIQTGIDPTRFVESYGYHVVAITLVYLVCTLSFFNRAPKLNSPLENAQISYYPVSDYLPPINTAAKAQMKPRKGAPKLARQEILSVPPNPDNTHQTIVTPPKIKLDHDVPLPNIVAWTPIPAAQPVAASARSVSQLQAPQLTPEVVAPTADVSKVHDKLELPTLPQPSVVEPPLSADQLKLKSGDLNMAQLEPTVAAPKLPVAPQRAAGVGNSAGKDVPPSPNVQNLPAQGQGQLIALGLNPADVRGPISMPNGNRSGEFHASPGGKPDAPGTPNVTGTGNSDNGGGTGKGNGAPPGIMVGAPPPGATTSAVAGTPNSGASVAKAGQPPAHPDLEARNRIFAAALKPTLPSLRDRMSPPPANLPEDPDRSIEQRVFGSRRYYSLIMNMPNLSSASGSWIIRFAELKQSDDKTALTAPVAMTKVDPAYPPDVLRDHVEGTVTLYAIIRADGVVDGIRILDSLDSRLDENAVQALSHWRFRPGFKNGAPVAVEAVVQIPFRMRKLQ
ncbi:MAG: TonB family protein [Candidatus Korobacteraceae bacterium]|jgi:TonB family protein